MGKDKNQNFKDHHQRWAIMKEHDQEQEHEQHPCSSIEEASTISNLTSSSSLTCSSSSSSDTADDASSANSSRSSLYDLSDLMSHLPIKRGLSKFYHGKSDSFTSLARVTSIDDIPKNKSHKKMMNKSYRSHTLPKPIISKKNCRRKKIRTCIKNELK
ncbi:hypothetical protein QVD17_11070 [Tagetes erecta]|uniref:Uncharacterized protein n=1 Tax=Tagetes erecta TaxID=13708 RepID=A0AAD8L3L5_TARER|nr:hypothetical protein QVD17_11070 [Tagetes erecta]